MQFTGTLKSWNDDCGFGFIEATQGGQGGQEISATSRRFLQQPAPVTALLAVSGAAAEGADGGAGDAGVWAGAVAPCTLSCYLFNSFLRTIYKGCSLK